MYVLRYAWTRGASLRSSARTSAALVLFVAVALAFAQTGCSSGNADLVEHSDGDDVAIDTAGDVSSADTTEADADATGDAAADTDDDVTVDAADGSDASDASDAPDALDASDAVDAPDASDALDAPDAPDGDAAVITEGCGDGVVDGDEACDDGNRVDTDACRNDCTVPYCGDGLVSSWSEGASFDAPAVTNPAGVLGRICGDGGSCPTRSCEVFDDASAPEHGICQALGYTRARRVDWSGSEGADDAVMLHAYNWVCAGFECEASDTGHTAPDCGGGQMLATIVCETPWVEACDEGPDNADLSDVCRTDCSAPRCGDGILDSGEGCDDGNRVDDDACRNLCVAATCGDGIVQDGEECDQAARNDDTIADGCRTACVWAYCGDGVVDSGEGCDEGGSNSDEAVDACRRDCVPAWCGDGVVDSGEACDAADANADADGAPCREDCALPYCGDGWLDDGEQCDDGNGEDADDCSNGCMIRGCGDGVVNGGEACDDGNAVNNDGCTNACELPRCGDGFQQEGEGCDDGNTVNDDGCTNVCELPRCGDGILQADEACDDGNDVPGDACTDFCTLPRCGDGVRSLVDTDVSLRSPVVTEPGGATGRVCDDGASCESGSCDVLDDGTAPEHGICQSLGFDLAVSVVWGGGEGENDNPMPQASNWRCDDYVCSGTGSSTFDDCRMHEMLLELVCRGQRVEPCDDGEDNADAPGACRTDCTRPACMDGIVDPGEACDDGNDIEDDGCSNLCRLAGCGDGLLQADEACDDGNDDDTDACRNNCTAAACGDGVVQSFIDGGESGIALVYDPTEGGVTAVTGVLASVGVSVEVFDNADRAYSSDAAFLRDYRLVILMKSGRLIDESEELALASYVASGGLLVVSGFDSIANPVDARLATIVGVTSLNDGPGARTATVTVEHPIFDGPFGRFPVGTTWEASDADHDNVTLVGGTRELMTISVAPKLTWAEDPVTGGVAVWWNGNAAGADWLDGGTGGAIFGNLIDVLLRSAELCDEGAGNSDAPDATCRPDCTPQRCGDGIVDAGEACDDGNDDELDGCSTACRLPACGDGFLQPAAGEVCDDGNDVDDDACTNDCDIGPAYVICGEAFIYGDGVYPGTTVDAGNDFPLWDSTDYAFSFVARSDGEVAASLCAGATFDTVLSVYDTTDGCPGEPFAQNDDACGVQSAIAFDVVEGRTYAVVVEGYRTTDVGPFELTIDGL